DKATVNLGDAQNPGLVIHDGALASMAGTVQASTFNFNVVGQLRAGALALSFVPATQRTPEQLALGGSAALHLLSGQTFPLQLGNAAGPGLTVQGGVFRHMNAVVGGDFDVFGVTVHSDKLQMTYASGDFTFSGSADFGWANNTFHFDFFPGSLNHMTIFGGVVIQLNASTVTNLAFLPSDLPG